MRHIQEQSMGDDRFDVVEDVWARVPDASSNVRVAVGTLQREFLRPVAVVRAAPVGVCAGFRHRRGVVRDRFAVRVTRVCAWSVPFGAVFVVGTLLGRWTA